MLVGSDIASALTILEPFNIDILGLNCATGPEQMKEHIKYLSSIIDEIIDNESPNKNGNNNLSSYIPSASSIYSSVPYKQDNSILIVGERLNASGSKKVRELLNNDDWDGLVSIAKQQQKENAHVLDVNVDYVGRDGVKDMKDCLLYTSDAADE